MQPSLAYESDAWQAFLKARELFFTRLRKAQLRHLIETADWTSELASSALRHAQAYRQLLDYLIAQHADAELRDALSVDTILIRVGAAGSTEDALIVLPTHPLRAAWYASYMQLLRNWEGRLADIPGRVRKIAIDLGMLRQLTPANTPAFVLHPECSEAFIFVRNLHFASALALPPAIPDPHRRYGDIATIVGAPSEQADGADLQPDRLAQHLETFHTLHPYADPLVTPCSIQIAVTFLPMPCRSCHLGQRLKSPRMPTSVIPRSHLILPPMSRTCGTRDCTHWSACANSKRRANLLRRTTSSFQALPLHCAIRTNLGHPP